MGIFDSYFTDIQRVARLATDALDKAVETIDTVEEKINNLPTEQEIKEKLVQKVKTAEDKTSD